MLRGTYLSDTVRCTVGEPYRPPSYLGSDFTDPTQRSVKCYADVRANAYIIGSGPPKLTTLLYRFPYWEGEFDQNDIEGLKQGLASYIDEEFPGREHVMFLGPPVDLSSEAWRLMGWWDVQRREDGTVMAVYDATTSEVEMELTALTSAVHTAHQERVTSNGGRIGEDTSLPMLVTDANQLRQYYTEVGAYAPGAPTPVQPPPPCGLAVPDQANNPGLMRDCMTLLAAKDTLRGTATLNWSVDTAIATWDGVTTSGTPNRVTKLLLPTKSLSGRIPAELGRLSELTHLDLSRNSLTGEIPGELGGLSNLEVLRLSGNSLTGCIPLALMSVATNDLSSLNLLYCVPAPEGLSAGTPGETSVPLSWDAVPNAGRYRVEYRIAASTGWTVDTDDATLTSHAVDDLACDTDYLLRVSARGSGTVYTAEWSEPSEAVPGMTSECRTPAFSASSYTFTVRENINVGRRVGTVSATDPNGDAVTYVITSGNAAGKFAIGRSSGEITVAGALDYETVPSYTLTVEVRDDRDGVATTTVQIAVTDVPEDAPPAPGGLSVSLTDDTFGVTWTAVTGASFYEVQQQVSGSGAGWALFATTTGVSATYSPAGGAECGTTYEFRVRSSGDGATYVADWGEPSQSEPYTTEVCNRAPRFGAPSYTLTTSENAGTSTSVGTISATDPDGDMVSYSITAGNDDGKFAIATSTGAITLTGTVDPDVLAFYALTVAAGDGVAGTSTAAVGVAVLLNECSNGTVVPRPRSNPRLVRDCSVLLAARDTLAGTASLDWSADTDINDWQGLRVERGDSPYVRVLLLTGMGLTGRIPPEIGGIADLRRLDLDDNMLTGQIPRELGSLSDMVLMYLQTNQLTGSIPAELGALSNLQTLNLSDNMLTGGIPAELGKLRNLRELLIEENSLTGGIPAELGALSNLWSLYLNENMLTEGIPAELGKLSNLTHLLLERNSLGGEIPPQLGDLTRLKVVYLRHNGLTGEIPAEWGELPNLTYLYLSSGNSFTGCIPSGLRDVADNDLEGLGLEYCGSSAQ